MEIYLNIVLIETGSLDLAWRQNYQEGNPLLSWMYSVLLSGIILLGVRPPILV